MANIKLHSDSPVSATSVSNTFIDEYMSDANGEFVKIYLYLLRLMNAPQASFSISSIADKFEHTEKDVKRALAYWERMHLLQLEYDNDKNLTGIRMLDSSSRDAARLIRGLPEHRQSQPAHRHRTPLLPPLWQKHRHRRRQFLPKRAIPRTIF